MGDKRSKDKGKKEQQKRPTYSQREVKTETRKENEQVASNG